MLPRALLVKSQLLRCKACGSRKRNGAQGGTCTRTGGALDAVPLLLGYLGMIGHPAGSCPRICRLKAGRPVWLNDRVEMNGPHGTQWAQSWRITEDLHPMPHGGGTIPLAPGPGPLVRFVIHGPPDRNRTCNSPVLSRMPLLIGLQEEV